MKTLHDELKSLLNRHSVERKSNTPDYILALFLEGCLRSYEFAMSSRDLHHGVDHGPKTTTGDSAQ